MNVRHLERRHLRTLSGALLVLSGAPAMAAEESEPYAVQVETLQKQVVEQTRRLNALKNEISADEAKLAEILRALQLAGMRGGAAPAGATASTDGAPAASGQTEARPTVAQTSSARSEPTADRPAATRGQDASALFERPGVLTPRGHYTLEPSLQYAYASNNRVALIGYTVIPALLIGLIDVREVKRNTTVAALTGRWGLTNRFELEAKLPYVYRSDTSISREVGSGSATDSVFNASGKGIGDVEMTARYQLNDGGVDKPYYVGSLRFKSRTGKDPFEVVTNRTLPGGQGTGLQEELPTGSGFYVLQPGLTFLLPSDPAVFFGGISYQHSFKRKDVSRKTDAGVDESLGTLQPGGTFGFNFGMGLALNEKSTFSIGYDHLSVGRLKQNGSTAPGSVRTQIGTLLFGYSLRLDDKRTLNLSVGAGLTRDTPDIQLSLRMPVSF